MLKFSLLIAVEQGSEPWISTFRVYAFNGGIDGEAKVSETQIPTQEKTSFETVYDAKAELRTWELKTRDSRACFLQYTQTKLNGERFIPFPLTSNYS